MSARSQVYSGTEWLVTTAATAYDLITDRPGYSPATGNNVRNLPRQLFCLVAGDAVVTGPVGPAISTIPLTAGMAVDIQAATLTAASTAVLLVIW